MVGSAESDLRNFLHVTGVSTSTGSYIMRANDPRLQAWLEDDLVTITAKHRHPDWIYFIPTRAINNKA